MQRSAISVESQLYKHLPDRSRGPTPVEKRGVDLRQAYTTGERKREREREGGGLMIEQSQLRMAPSLSE